MGSWVRLLLLRVYGSTLEEIVRVTSWCDQDVFVWGRERKSALWMLETWRAENIFWWVRQEIGRSVRTSLESCLAALPNHHHHRPRNCHPSPYATDFPSPHHQAEIGDVDEFPKPTSSSRDWWCGPRGQPEAKPLPKSEIYKGCRDFKVTGSTLAGPEDGFDSKMFLKYSFDSCACCCAEWLP